MNKVISGKKDSFIKKILNKYLCLNFFGWIIYFIGLFCDTIIGGLTFGEDAISAIQIIWPVISAIELCSYLITDGIAVMHASAVGQNDFKKADQIFGEALIFQFFLGIIISILLIVLKEPILNIFELSDQVYYYASSYYQPLILLGLVMPLSRVTYKAAQSDCEIFYITLCNIVCSFGNIVLSLILSKTSLGVAGISLSTFLSEVIGAFCVLPHFFRKNNSYKAKLYFNFKDCFKAFVISFGSITTIVFNTIADFIMNLIICRQLGERFLVPYSIVNFVCGIAAALQMCGVSVCDCCSVAIGEKNSIDIKAYIKQSLKQNVFVSLFFFTVMMALYKLWPVLYSIDTADLKELAEYCTLLIAPTFILRGIVYHIALYYNSYGNPFFSIIDGLISLVLVPAILSIILINPLGFYGIPLSFGLAPVVSIIVILVLDKIIYKKIYHIDEYNNNQHVYDYNIDEPSIIKLRDELINLLNDNQVNNSLTNKIALATEELLIMIKNQNKKIVTGRLFIDIDNQQIRLFFKDTGKPVDAVTDKKIKTMNDFILDQVLTTTNKSFSYSVISSDSHSLVFSR